MKIKMDPKESKNDIALAYRTLGDMEMEKGNYHKAVEAFEKSMQFRLGNPGLYSKIGNCYLELGREKKANLYFQRV